MMPRRYPKYQASDASGAPELPIHWRSKRLRYVSRVNPSKSEITLGPDAPVSFIPMEAVGEYGGLRLDAERLLDEIDPGYTYFADNDVVVAKITPCFENGKGALARGLTNGVAFGTTELHVIRAGDELDPRFLFYISISVHFRKIGESEMYGAAGQKRIADTFIKDFQVGLPPLTEQKTICDFLDQETTRIDALVDRKRHLLELLEEKRLAVITHTVTKGLDPNVPMRHSGIGWFGQIPAHWEVKRQKFISPKITVGIVVTPAAYYVDEGIPALRGFNVKERSLNLHDMAFISPEANELHAKSKIFAGDLVAVRTGQPGTTAVVPRDLDGANCVDLIIVRKSPEVDQLFIAYFANSDLAKLQYGMGSEGALQQHFNIDTAKSLLVPLPPLDEQKRIVDHLEAEERKIKAVAFKIQAAVDRLTEYRSTLITNAVTGKIDVRALANKEAAA
jgi:type I restriction enzyme S subunit